MEKSNKKPAAKKSRKKTAPPSVKKPEQGAPFSIWMDKYQIMEEFQISPRTLYNWRRHNCIPHTRVGKKFYYNRTEFEDDMRRNMINPGTT
jgi:hypothetical protein